MKIEKKIENNNLIVTLEGRLDTNTAAELENEMQSLNGIESITFDFDDLEYISSSGLRLMLKCKKEVDNTKIINCNPEVFEIFNITGFSEMMQVEKAFRKISIENCEKIGEGFYGNIYRIDPETIVKVYKIPDAIEYIKSERESAKKAFVLGVPTAIPYDVVRVNDSYGAVFELLNAQTLVNLINSDENIDNFAKKSSEVLKGMHKKEIEKDMFPSRKEIVIDVLKECEESFSKETFEKLLYLIETIPDTNNFLHCDFQVKNIMVQGDEILLIDMDKLSIGHPIFEFASMYATYYAFACVDKKNTDKFLGLPLDIANKIFDKTFEYYYSDKSYEELEDIKLKLSVISYIQVLNLRTKYPDDTCDTQQEEIEFCKKYLTDISKKLDTLKY